MYPYSDVYVKHCIMKHCILGTFVSSVKKIYRHSTWVGFEPMLFAILDLTTRSPRVDLISYNFVEDWLSTHTLKCL